MSELSCLQVSELNGACDDAVSREKLFVTPGGVPVSTGVLNQAKRVEVSTL